MRETGTRASLLAVGAAAALFVGCALAGVWLERHGTRLHLSGSAPLRGGWRLHEPTARIAAPVALALLALWQAPRLADRLRWPALLAGSWGLAAVWAMALAYTEGVAGLTRPLTESGEYLPDLEHVGAIEPFLATFTDHALGGSPGFQWETHTSGHPPGILLVFVLLARIGLGGAGWASALCIAAGASAVPAVLLTVRLLGDRGGPGSIVRPAGGAGEAAARRVAPYLALLPGAVWVATSADALFLGVSAWGICALAYATARTADGRARASAGLGLAGGLLLGALLFLSYGMALVAVILAAVVLAVAGGAPAWRVAVRPLAVGSVGVLAVVAAFGNQGFWWWEGLGVAADRVREGPAWIDRPTAYFVVANLAALAVTVGPATVAALPRLRRSVLAWPVAGALVAVGIACASNLSKGEVERIYLPFAVWLVTATAFLPRSQRRWWLGAQLAVGLAVQLGLRSPW